MACSCEIFTRPILDVNFQEHGFRRNAAVSIVPHFVISSFPVGLFLLHARDVTRFYIFRTMHRVIYICEKGEQDAHFI